MLLDVTTEHTVGVLLGEGDHKRKRVGVGKLSQGGGVPLTGVNNVTCVCVVTLGIGEREYTQ